MKEQFENARNWMHDHQAIAVGLGVVIILIVVSMLIR